MVSASSQQNPFLLAADASPALLPLLQANPSLASSQDASGYSLLHALTSYNHLDLLKSITQEFKLSPNIRDEDEETALFVAETVQAAQVLVEELGVDIDLRNNEGQTAEEKIREEGDFVTVADYLKETRVGIAGHAGSSAQESRGHPPPLPKGVKMNVGTMAEGDVPAEVDEGLRRRIEELAQREDFLGEEAQGQLRELIQDAVRDVGAEGSNARRRVE
ncbi:MAG: hypothetical protein MMC23_003971 [Stictis urceolatum]|nr:hypothetical protein [Stictis urceolata]